MSIEIPLLALARGLRVAAAMKHRTAVTTIEALVALSIALVAFGIAIALLQSASAGARRATDRLDRTEEAHRALIELRVLLCDAWSIRIEEGGDAVAFGTPRGSGRAWIDRAARRLVSRVSDGAAARTLLSGVDAVRFESPGAGLTRVVLEIGRQRFSDDVFAAVLGPRDPDVPWSPALETDEGGS
jgi:type II secretory pathway pseudopilin PulG